MIIVVKTSQGAKASSDMEIDHVMIVVKIMMDSKFESGL